LFGFEFSLVAAKSGEKGSEKTQKSGMVQRKNERIA